MLTVVGPYQQCIPWKVYKSGLDKMARRDVKIASKNKKVIDIKFGYLRPTYL